MSFTPKEIGVIVTAYTGIGCCSMKDFHIYIEKLLGEPIFTHELASKEVWEKIKEKAKPDFIRLAEWCSK